MKKVLDQNMARSELLRDYLTKGNTIIVTDDFLLEPCKSSDLEYTLNQQLEILRDYPDQILVTYDRGELVRKELAQGMPLAPEALISSSSTEWFRELLTFRDEQFKKSVNVLQLEAEERLKYQDNFLETNIRSVIMKAEELIRKKPNSKSEYRVELKRLSDIKETSLTVLNMLLVDRVMNKKSISNFNTGKSFTLFYLFTHLWRIIDWALKGGASNAKKGISGDSFDLKYVLVSCYFDGVLSKEKWLCSCRNEALKTIV
jgi:hypothetical protein